MFRLAKYDFFRLKAKLKYIVMYLIFTVLILLISSKDLSNIDLSNYDVNMWEYYTLLLYDNTLLIYIPAILSILVSMVMFFDNELTVYIHVRTNSKRKWFLSKIITVLIVNFIIIVVFCLIILILGGINSKFELNWSQSMLAMCTPPIKQDLLFVQAFFYSPIKLFIINILSYTFYISSLTIIFSMIGLKFNKVIVGISLSMVYVLTSKLIVFMGRQAGYKYIIFDNYMFFSYRNYFNLDYIKEQFLTVREALIIPFIGLVFIISLSTVIIKYINFFKGEKK